MDAYDVVNRQSSPAGELAILAKWLEACKVALETVDVLASRGYPHGEPCQAFDGYQYRRRWYGKQYIDIDLENRVLWPLNPDLDPPIRLKSCGVSDIYLGDDGNFYLYTQGLGYGVIAAGAFESSGDLTMIIGCLRNLQERAKISTP